MQARNLIEPPPSCDAAAWDRVWSRHPYRHAEVHAERARIKVGAAVEMGLRFKESDRVLDLACGSGQTLIEAAHRASGNARFVGLDISDVALGLARANFKRAGVRVKPVRAEWLRLPFRDGAFDKVIAFMAPFPSVIREIDRVLAPGGKLFMVALSRDSISSALYRLLESIVPGPFDDRRNYSARDLISELGATMTVEEWRILHSGSDRPISRTLDRAIGQCVPRWGRYVAVRCAKSAAR